METSDFVIETALELGFDLAGVAPLAPPPDAQRFDAWLAAGHHASMEYLERGRDRIVDPARILPAGRSLVVVGLGHSRPALELDCGGKVARYAAGRDYHNIIGKRLRKLARALRERGLVERGRAIVDAGPLLERSHAEVAGLGFASKAANLLNKRFGPWFFLGELIVEAELEPSAPEPGTCGSCTACIDACPTDAIRSSGVVDSRRCISYLTIEHRGPIPENLHADLGEWAFGCDVCSEVCPFGTRAPDLTQRFGLHEKLAEEPLTSWLAPEPDPEHWRGSPLQRPRRAGRARNAAIVLANRPSEAGRSALLSALANDPDPLVRATCATSLGRGFAADEGVRAALERAGKADADDAVRAAARAALERARR